MISKSREVIIFVVCIVPLAVCDKSDVVEEERSSFFRFTEEVEISGSTMELVENLGAAVMQHAAGDRPVSRYYELYETPFVQNYRRKGE